MDENFLVFKQGVNKLYIVFLIEYIILCIGLLCYIVFGLNVRGTDLLIFLGLILSLFLFVIAISLACFEWFHVYEDRIEVRSCFGLRNVVYFKDVNKVYDIYTTDSQKGYYIFEDGRNNCSDFQELRVFSNTKKYRVRIYKTKQLIQFIQQSNLNIEKT